MLARRSLRLINASAFRSLSSEDGRGPRPFSRGPNRKKFDSSSSQEKEDRSFDNSEQKEEEDDRVHQVNEQLAMPSDAHIEAVAEKIVRSEDFDPNNLDELAKHLNQKPFGRSWQEEAESPAASAEFQQIGVENAASVMKRIEDRAARGLANDVEDLKQVQGYISENENPALWAINENAASLSRLLSNAREYYEMSKLNASQKLNRKVGVQSLPLNARVEDEQLFAKADAEDAEEQFVLPEELDTKAKLPRERNLILEEAASKKCTICWCKNEAPPLDPLNVHLLLKFVNVEGRMLPRRQTKLCAKYQRKVATTLRRAKHLGLFSFKNGRFTVTDPFEETLTHEQVLDDLARKTWYRLYPSQPFPGFAKNPVVRAPRQNSSGGQSASRAKEERQ